MLVGRRRRCGCSCRMRSSSPISRYIVCYIALVYFFSYFWTTVTFQPKEVANNLRDMGSFIPGLRAGKRTADYLETVMVRVTYVGAAFLASIAVIPEVMFKALDVPYTVASFLGWHGPADRGERGPGCDQPDRSALGDAELQRLPG